MSVISVNKYLKTSLNYSYYSLTEDALPTSLKKVLEVFKNNINKIETINGKNNGKKSDIILKYVKNDLLLCGFDVESDKKHQIDIKLSNNKNSKSFRVDAINIKDGILIEIEAGRAVANYQFLKDIMECSMISSKNNIYLNNSLISLDKRLYLVIAVRNIYTIKGSNHYDYKSVLKWLNTLNISKLNLKLNGILVIGY